MHGVNTVSPMKIAHQTQVTQQNQNHDAKATGTGSLKGFFVTIGQGFKKIGRFFTNTLPNLFKPLNQRTATTPPSQNEKLHQDRNPGQQQGLSKEDLEELRNEFDVFNERQTYLETEEQAHILEKEMDKEVVILDLPCEAQSKAKSSTDLFEELEHALKEDIAQHQKKVEGEAKNLLHEIELSDKGERITASPQEMNKFISNAAKELHGDRTFSEGEVSQLIHDLGGPLTNDERIEIAAQTISGKQELSFDELEKLMQDLDAPTQKEEPSRVLPQETKKMEPRVFSTLNTDFLPRPTGNPFQRANNDK